ncbi:hypothetical protein GDO78_018752 [Eleutherodactylus coqui]|uniref:Isochorismatase-like domain-containing protein n=1 Tax=Eleutherodactylus coqui TaxID=57060 RepID=A0A8J6B8L4_ELECQ|nr:hypothetical protein GDO78_018752 [Eleutherodactylus coqui]
MVVVTAKILEIPVVITEQYPKGLGPTVPELGADGIKKYSKTCFNMLTPEVERELQAVPERRSVILCGIETQACIMSTTLDLLDKGFDVHIVADACSSRRHGEMQPHSGPDRCRGLAAQCFT